MFESIRIRVGRLLRAFSVRFVRLLGNPRTIYDGNGVRPYLSRYYLRGKPKMPDGSDPFDRFGNPKEGALWNKGRLSIVLHRFHRSDVDRELHNHPWRWSLSLVLSGGYVEERRVGDRVVKRRILPLSLNWIRHDTFHRVDLIERDAWTLFITGPKVASWGFWCRASGLFTPWREFLARRQGT